MKTRQAIKNAGSIYAINSGLTKGLFRYYTRRSQTANQQNDESVVSVSEKKEIESMIENVKTNIGYAKPVVIEYKPYDSYSSQARNMQVNTYLMKPPVLTIFNPVFYAKPENKMELKTTLTHEFGHLAGHHSYKTHTCSATLIMGTVGLTAKFATTFITPTLMGIIVGLPGLGLSMTVFFSASILLVAYLRRHFEFEADNAIVKYCSRDEVKARIREMEEMAINQHSVDLPKIPLLETHPSFWDRSANLKKQMHKKDERETRCVQHQHSIRRPG